MVEVDNSASAAPEKKVKAFQFLLEIFQCFCKPDATMFIDWAKGFLKTGCKENCGIVIITLNQNDVAQLGKDDNTLAFFIIIDTAVKR